MSARSRSDGSIRWLAAGIVLGLSLIWFGAPVAAVEPAEAFPIPADALVLIHVRLADIWKSDSFSEMRRILLKAGPEALQAFDRRFEPAPSSLDRLTIMMAAPREGAGEPAFAFYLTTSTQFDPDKLMQKMFPQGQAKRAGNAQYHVDDKAGLAVHIVNRQTILLGSPAAVHATLEKPGGTGGPLAETIKLATPAFPISMGIHVAALPVPRRELPAAFAPLLKSKLVTVTVEIAKEFRINMKMQFPDEETAMEGEKAVRAGLAMARAALPVLRTQFEAMLRGKDQGSSGRVAEDLPEAIAGLFGIGMIKEYEDLLTNFPLERRSSTLQASLALPGSSSIYNPATAGMLTALLLPAVQKVREAANRAKDSNNLKHMAIGMLHYHDVNDRFPAAAICSKDGKPLLSWRVALLPYIDEDKLYKQFKLDEPWDSPHNKALLPKMPKVYAMPVQETNKETHTHYRVFVGPQAGFELQKGRRFSDITDGTSNTLMIVAAAEAVPWTKPDELVYDPKGPLPKLGVFFAGGFNAAFMDGSVRTISRSVDEAVLRAAITPAGGEVFRLDDF